jgi:hypothetical protein
LKSAEARASIKPGAESPGTTANKRE